MIRFFDFIHKERNYRCKSRANSQAIKRILSSLSFWYKLFMKLVQNYSLFLNSFHKGYMLRTPHKRPYVYNIRWTTHKRSYVYNIRCIYVQYTIVKPVSNTNLFKKLHCFLASAKFKDIWKPDSEWLAS